MSKINQATEKDTKPTDPVDPNVELKALQTLYDALQADFAALQEENAKLKKQLAAQASAEIKGKLKTNLHVPDETVKFEGKKYKANVSGVMRSGGEIISTKEINADPELLKEILSVEGQGIYKEVV